MSEYLRPFDERLASETGLHLNRSHADCRSKFGLPLKKELSRVNQLSDFARSPILTAAGREDARRNASIAFDELTNEVAIADLEADIGAGLLQRYLNIFGLWRGALRTFGLTNRGSLMPNARLFSSTNHGSVYRE